jgi:hypothetical protein
MTQSPQRMASMHRPATTRQIEPIRPTLLDIRDEAHPARLAVKRQRGPCWRAIQGVGRSRTRYRIRFGLSVLEAGTPDQPFPPPFHGTNRTKGGRPLRRWTSIRPASSNALMALDLSWGENCQSDSRDAGGFTQLACSVSVRNLMANSIIGALTCPQATARAICKTGIGPLMNKPSLCAFRTGPIFLTGI